MGTILSLASEEAKIHRPIYLDMVKDAVILVDKDEFMESVFMGLGKDWMNLRLDASTLRTEHGSGILSRI